MLQAAARVPNIVFKHRNNGNLNWHSKVFQVFYTACCSARENSCALIKKYVELNHTMKPL